MAVNQAREFILRIGGQSDGFVKAVNRSADAAGKLTSILANMARQAALAMPALALKTTALTLMADAYRRVHQAAVESFEPIEAATVRLQQTTTMSVKQINNDLMSMYQIARSTGTAVTDVMGAMGAAQRGGARGYGALLGAQAGTAMSLVMGGTPEQWAQMGVEGGQRFGMPTEDYLDRILYAHQRGRNPEWVDAQLEAGRNLDHAADTLRDAANALQGTREFEQRRADNAWSQVGEKWGAAFTQWGLAAPTTARLKYTAAKMLSAPASGLYNTRMQVQNEGWWGWFRDFVSPGSRELNERERERADAYARSKGYDVPIRQVGPDGQPIDVYSSPGGGRYWTEGGAQAYYGPGAFTTADGRLSTREEAGEQLKYRQQVRVDAKRAASLAGQRAYGERVLSGTDRSDRQRLIDAMRSNALRAEELAMETQRAKTAMQLVTSETSKTASGMAAAARLTGVQGGIAAFGVVGQIQQLQELWGPATADALTLMSGLTPDQVIAQARGMVERAYGSRVAGAIDWTQFQPSAPSGIGGTAPMASPQQAVVIPLESQDAYRAAQKAALAAGGSGRVAVPMGRGPG